MTNKKIVGIDLGTTFSAIAVLDDIGKPEVLPDIKTNNRITPSAVYLASDPNKSAVGTEALAASKAEPARVITEMKTRMRDNNEVVYSVDEAKWIERKFEDKKENEFSPAQLSSMILEKLKGFSENIDKAVITVPAMFAQRAREATRDAAKIAGLSGYSGEAVDLINEPEAAILHYASLEGSSVNGKVMVFDLGGGTFDVSIANVTGKKVKFIHSEGNPNLGGKDFDRALLEYLSDEYNNQLGAKLNLDDIEYLQQAEELKKVLSARESHGTIIDGPNGPSKTIEVTRDKFNNIISRFIDETSMKIRSCLKKSNLKPEDITQTLLVGGSTRISAVVDSITKIMGKPPTKGVNVDEAVSAGAAIYAGLNAPKDELNAAQVQSISEVDLESVANYFFGTFAVIIDQEQGIAEQVNTTVIKRGTKVPCAQTQKYTVLNPEGFDASITQSEDETKNSKFVIVLHNEIVKLNNAKEGDEILVTYSYDKNQMMHCRFECGTEKYEIDIKPKSSETVEQAKEQIKNFKIE